MQVDDHFVQLPASSWVHQISDRATPSTVSESLNASFPFPSSPFIYHSLLTYFRRFFVACKRLYNPPCCSRKLRQSFQHSPSLPFPCAFIYGMNFRSLIIPTLPQLGTLTSSLSSLPVRLRGKAENISFSPYFPPSLFSVGRP